MSNPVQSALLGTILESVADLVVVTDTDGRVVFFNNASEELTGYSFDELEGRQTWKILIPEEDREELIAGYNRLVADGDVQQVEQDWIIRDGQRRTIEWSCTPVFDEAHQQTLVVNIGRDISDRQQQQRELARARQELRMQEKLKRTNRKLQRSNAELERFATVASHDLQEPLRKIRAFGDRLDTKFGDQLPERGRNYLARMCDAAGRMSVLIDDLLTFARVTTRAKPFQPVDLGDIVDDVLRDLEFRIERTGGRVDVGELPTFEADPIQMRLLFQNLIGNALKFHRQETAPVVQIDTTTSVDGEYYHIAVEDNGTGFDEKYLDRIFEVFERLHGRGVYEGTGIGLAICKKIVARHRGEVTAASTPGEGSRFVVTIPDRQPTIEKNVEEQIEREIEQPTDSRLRF